MLVQTTSFVCLGMNQGDTNFPSLAKDRSVVPLVRSSDPFLSEPELHYEPFNVTFKCKMQLSAVWFGSRSVEKSGLGSGVEEGGLKPVSCGSFALYFQEGYCQSFEMTSGMISIIQCAGG